MQNNKIIRVMSTTPNTPKRNFSQTKKHIKFHLIQLPFPLLPILSFYSPNKHCHTIQSNKATRTTLTIELGRNSHMKLKANRNFSVIISEIVTLSLQLKLNCFHIHKIYKAAVTPTIGNFHPHLFIFPFNLIFCSKVILLYFQHLVYSYYCF